MESDLCSHKPCSYNTDSFNRFRVHFGVFLLLLIDMPWWITFCGYIKLAIYPLLYAVPPILKL